MKSTITKTNIHTPVPTLPTHTFIPSPIAVWYSGIAHTRDSV